MNNIRSRKKNTSRNKIDLKLSPESAALLVPQKPRRAAILGRIEKAALTLYVERGIENVSIEEIADAAEVSRRTFFRYCPTRDDVQAGLYTRAFVRHISDLRDRPVNERLSSAWLAVIRNSSMWEESETAELSRIVLAKYPESVAAAMDRAVRLTIPLFTEVLEWRLSQVGENRAGARVIAAVLIAINTQAYVRWMSEGCKGAFADMLQLEIETAVNALKLQ